MLSHQRQRDARIIRRHGGGLKYTLRRKNTFEPSLGLKLSSAASAGATSISLTGTTMALSRKDGIAKKGAIFQLAGVTGTYTVATDATITGNPYTLTFTPALAGPGALGAALTWTQPYSDHVYTAMNGASQEITDERMVASGLMVRWLTYRADLPAPAVLDVLGGLTVRDVEPIGSAGVSRYKVTVGAAS